MCTRRYVDLIFLHSLEPYLPVDNLKVILPHTMPRKYVSLLLNVCQQTKTKSFWPRNSHLLSWEQWRTYNTTEATTSKEMPQSHRSSKISPMIGEYITTTTTTVNLHLLTTAFKLISTNLFVLSSAVSLPFYFNKIDFSAVMQCVGAL